MKIGVGQHFSYITKTIGGFTLVVLACALLPSSFVEAAPAKTSSYTISRNACSQLERWNFSRDVAQEWATAFRGFLSGEIPGVYGYSEGLGLHKGSRNKVEKLLGIYWKSRSLYKYGLIHGAAAGFDWIAAQPVKKKTIGIQIAALECMNKIQDKFPEIYVSNAVSKQFKRYRRLLTRSMKREKKGYETLLTAITNMAMRQIARGSSSKRIEETISHLRGTGPHYELAMGMHQANNRKFRKATENLRKFVNRDSLPDSLQKRLDYANLTLARSYYKRKQYKNASQHLTKVSKDSNVMVRVLAELAWVHLMERNYGESVGVVMNLQSGGFRKTFAPEGMMVMAMALNELCQFPSSLRTIQILKNKYRKTFKWLSKWLRKVKRNQKNPPRHYDAMVAQIEGKSSKIPPQVINEWMRSPIFLAAQEELNLYADERDFERRFLREHREETSKKKAELKDLSDDLRGRVVEAKAAKKRGEPLSPGLKQELAKLKLEKLRFKRLLKAQKEFKRLMAALKKEERARRNLLVDRIEQDINARNTRMIKKLRFVAENSYLIEVEIYNGASDDVVWQNAHPDYKDFVKDQQEQNRLIKSEDVWNWGTAMRAEDGREEIWSDELGSLRADLSDNCGNKDRYLEIQLASGKK